MSTTSDIMLKICMMGEGSVGKSSLIRKFVFDDFDDSYITTIGTKITKKEIVIQHPKDTTEVNVTLLIWDLMGQKGFRNLLRDAYFFGAQGLIAVTDITNQDSLDEIAEWVDSAYGITGKVPVMFLANKHDLIDNAIFNLDKLKETISGFRMGMTCYSSAKTGENVELTFNKLCGEILKR